MSATSRSSIEGCENAWACSAGMNAFSSSSSPRWARSSTPGVVTRSSAVRVSSSAIRSWPSVRTASARTSRAQLGLLAAQVVVGPGGQVTVGHLVAGEGRVLAPEGPVGGAVAEGHRQPIERRAELRPEHVVGVHAGWKRQREPAVDQHQGPDAVRVLGGEARGHVGAHGVAGHDGARGPSASRTASASAAWRSIPYGP
ncbi:MAG: hypothetical protein WKF40_07635 [Thermoleophilaceae bacterium]